MRERDSNRRGDPTEVNEAALLRHISDMLGERLGRLEDRVDKRFDKVDAENDEIKERIGAVEVQTTATNGRVTALEKDKQKATGLAQLVDYRNWTLREIVLLSGILTSLFSGYGKDVVLLVVNHLVHRQ